MEIGNKQQHGSNPDPSDTRRFSENNWNYLEMCIRKDRAEVVKVEGALDKTLPFGLMRENTSGKSKEHSLGLERRSER